MYSMCNEFSLGNKGDKQAIFSFHEFRVTWPKNLYNKKGYKIEFVGMRLVLSEDGIKFKLVYPNINPNFDIDGIKIGWGNSK